LLLGRGFWQMWSCKLPPGRPLPEGPQLLIGHRGCRLGKPLGDGPPPENTLEAFTYALDHGAHGFELDTRMTRDGVPVVFHDAQVGRCLTHDGSNPLVSDLSLKELQQLPYKEAASIRVHTLDEAVELAKKRGAHILIEIKDMNRRSELAAHCVAIIRKYDMLDHAMVISFDPLALYYVRREDPDVRTCFLWTPGLMAYYATPGTSEVLSPAMRLLAPLLDLGLRWCSHPALLPTYLGVSAIGPGVEWRHAHLDAAKKLGMATYVWVVNDPVVRDEVRTLASRGLYAYSTDHLWD